MFPIELTDKGVKAEEFMTSSRTVVGGVAMGRVGIG